MQWVAGCIPTPTFVRGGGPAPWGEQHVAAVHQVAVVALACLRVDDGDVRDDGDCGDKAGVQGEGYAEGERNILHSTVQASQAVGGDVCAGAEQSLPVC